MTALRTSWIAADSAQTNNARTVAEREKQRVALSSIGAALFLTGMKAFVGFETNSLGILSEAAHSALDLLAALLTYVAVRVSDRPPDPDHRYGHGKIENLSALAETLILVATCVWIIVEAVERLIYRSAHVEATVWSFSVMLVAMVVDFGRSRALRSVARKHHSQALEADALHFSSDIWSSLTVLLGLVFVSLGYPRVDAIAAMVVAVLVMFVSYRLGRRTIDALMDRTPPEQSTEVEKLIRDVDGVEELRVLRMRTSGSRTFVEATVAVSRTEPFERVHRVMDEVERTVRTLHPGAEVMIHAEPCVGSQETLIDKIRMIVLKMGLRAPHNLEVHESDGRYYIDFDIEYRTGNTLVQAHELATELEGMIRRDLPSVAAVTIHLEESALDKFPVTKVEHEEHELARRIRSVVMEDTRVLECRDVLLLRQGVRYVLTLTCVVLKSATLDEAHHTITEIENKLYVAFPVIRRITIHAEPAA